MWGGDSLKHRDQDRKKSQTNRTYVATTTDPLNQEADDDDWPSPDGEEEDDYTEEMSSLEEVDAWVQHTAAAFAESPSDEVCLANFQEARKHFYKEARKALDSHRVNRGFYQDRGKGKGKSKDSGKGFQGRCMRCGKLGHKAMQCRQNINGTSSAGSKASDSGRVGFVFTAKATDEVKPVSMPPLANFASLTMETQNKAILDCGASESTVGAHTLQMLYDTYASYGWDPDQRISVNRDMRRSFIFGNKETSLALGLATIQVGVAGHELSVPIHIVEGQTPLLLSSQWLAETEAIIDFKTGEAQFNFAGTERI